MLLLQLRTGDGEYLLANQIVDPNGLSVLSLFHHFELPIHDNGYFYTSIDVVVSGFQSSLPVEKSITNPDLRSKYKENQTLVAIITDMLKDDGEDRAAELVQRFLLPPSST